MTDDDLDRAAARVRREPPRFRRARVRDIGSLGPRLARVTLAGPELEGLAVEQPAASVRVLFPTPSGIELVLPAWNGNEFLLPDGRRPAIRTFTPRRADPDAGELVVDIVRHGTGVASGWVESAQPDAEVAVSGPGRGYAVDAAATAFLLAGDETAIPAISQLLETLPSDRAVAVHVEVAEPDGRIELPDHAGASVRWHDLRPGAPPGDALVAAVHDVDVGDDTRIWAAGEAAAMQRIRKHLFDGRGIPRARATVRGYWKHGRTGE